MQKSSLFHHKTIKKLREKTDLTFKQIEASREWLGYLDAGELKKEKSNYPIFMKTILQDILGFPMKDIGQEDENVDMLYPKKGKKELCVECKGTGTAELDALQHRAKKEHETPIKQTWDYVGSTGSDYGICTNYKEFVLMTRNDYPHMHWFDFESIRKDQENLKEFVGIFSKESLIDNEGFVEDLHKESVDEEKEFTTEFYKLFHQTRLMMIQAFQEKEGVTKDEAINYAQLYLNRLVFIFFAEDKKLLEKKLFMETVKKSLNSNISEISKSVSNQILDLFSIMDGGSDKLGIVGFGGELFQEKIPPKIYFLDLRDKKFFNNITSKIKLKIKPDNAIQNLIDRERKLNPIIKNLLMMNSFDFTTDLNVNILGQIFEQSVSDLEELKEEKTSRRKIDGVYYTPEYITDYICRNTIIPYLSKSGTNSTQTLIYEYENNIEELEKKFREIKILDPACGSGHFLIKAVDILLEIHKEILNLKQFLRPEKYSDNGQAKMDKWNEESEAKEIIENNIYGVDINPESAEITKLALFLKIAERGKKLSELTNNIKVGNSLISDKSIDKMAFNWELEFPQIFYDENDKERVNTGFNVVIGNPPYLNIRDFKMSQDMKDCITNRFPTADGQWDLFVPFVELGLNMLRKGGNFSMIIKDSIGISSYTTKLIEFIESNYFLYQIDFFPNIKLFKAGVHNKIIFIEKNKREKKTKRILHEPTQSDIKILNSAEGRKKYTEKEVKFEINKTKTINLGDICFATYGLRPNSNKDDPKPKFRKSDLLSNIKTKLCNRVYTEGKFIDRYRINKELFLEWNSERCPSRCTRTTYPELYEPNKLLMSRQKRIVAFSDKKHIFDTTIVAGVRFCDMAGVDNSHIRKYFVNIQGDRKELEKISMEFDLKYLLGILNSKLIKYHLHYNSVGNIDTTPDDWKKIPIKNIPTNEQKPIIRVVEQIISLNEKNTIFPNDEIKKLDHEVDDLVFKLYGITEEEKKIIESI